MALKTVALSQEVWTVGKSGISVDASRAVRIQQGGGVPRDELRARARLISVAPDGYRLAMAIHDFVRLADPGAHSDLSLVVDAARALLAKANGELEHDEVRP